jgi:hypothetical protein
VSESSRNIFLSHGNMERNVPSKTSQVRLFVFIRTIFCLIYIIHSPDLKNDPRLAPLHESLGIPYCQRFYIYIYIYIYIYRRQECANPGRLVAGMTMLRMADYYYLQHKYFNIKLRISSNVTNLNHHINRSENVTSEVCDFCMGIASWHTFERIWR